MGRGPVIEDLSRRQLELAMHVVGELAQLRDLREYPRAVVALARSVIDCDYAAYNVLELRSGRATVVVDPPKAARDEQALILADFITRRALHRTEVHAYIYSRTPMEYRLAAALGSATRRPGKGTSSA